MTEMAPEQPVPDEVHIDLDGNDSNDWSTSEQRLAELADHEPAPIAELLLSYTWENKVLEVTCENGGAQVVVTLDYKVDAVAVEADILVASIPSMVAAVVDKLTAEEVEGA